MALIRECRGKAPIYGKNCWFADNATIVGDVVMGDDCSVWFSTVLRGDVNSIRMGNKVNIQDATVIHCTFEKTNVKIGDNVSVGHGAIIHGCTINSNVLVGMGAIIMDNAVIGEGAIIAAGTVILEGTKVESGSIYAGVPGKKVKDVPEKLKKGEIERIANSYVKYASWYK